MKKRSFAACLLALCAAVSLSAKVVILADDPDNHITLDTKTSLMTIKRFGGLKPQQPLVLGQDAFTTKQMEGKHAETTWKPAAETASGSHTLETTLTQRIAGLDLDGVTYRKAIQYNPTVPEIKVTMTFSNSTDQLRYAYWGACYEFYQRPNVSEAAFLPRTIGTFPQGPWLHLQFYAQLPAWASALAEPWCAKVDQEGKAALAFLVEQQDLSTLYTNKGKNVGIMFDKGYLPPKSSVSTTCRIRPVKGLSAISTVNNDFAAVLNDAKTRIGLSVFPYVNGQLSGTATLVDKDRKTIIEKPVSLKLTKGTVATFTIPHAKHTDHCAIIFKGTVDGRPFATEQYSENGTRMQTIRATAFAPYFTRPIMAKQAPAAVANVTAKPRKQEAVCLFGLFTPFNRFDRILKGWKMDTFSVWDVGMKDIPPASNLDEKSVMILSNAFANGMEVCLPRVRSFVANGGLLIVMGGPSAFGSGAYEKNSTLKELLPVTGHSFDLQPTAGKDQFDRGVALTGVGIAGKKPPHVYWNHQGAQLRPTAKVLWKLGTQPALVQDSYGKGTVLCFLGSPLGDPKDGNTPYWDSEEYVNAMRSIIDNILKEARK